MPNSYAREDRDFDAVSVLEPDPTLMFPGERMSFLQGLMITPDVVTEDRVREIIHEELRDYRLDRVRSDPLFQKIMKELSG